MKRAAVLLAALCLCACSRSGGGAVFEELTADPARLDEEAPRVAKLAASQGRGVLLYFHAAWCEPCKALKQAFNRPGNRAAFSRYFLVKVDVDQMPGTRVLGLNVAFIPLLARLTKEGTVAGTLGGEAFGDHPPEARVDEVLVRFLGEGGV